MSHPKPAPGKKNTRRDSFHQRQVRFFIILGSAIVFLLMAGLLYLINR
jgi:hypothetical protein